MDPCLTTNSYPEPLTDYPIISPASLWLVDESKSIFRNQSRNQTGLKKQLEDSPNFQRRKNQPKFEALNIDCDDEPD